MNWNKTMQINEICSDRSKTVMLRGREKSITRTSTTKFVHVHFISIGNRTYINHNRDMVMIHFKLGRKQDDPTPIIQNPFVGHALRHPLFLDVCFHIPLSVITISRKMQHSFQSYLCYYNRELLGS